MKKQVSFLKISLKYLALTALFLTVFPLTSFLASLTRLNNNAVLVLSITSVLSGYFGFALRNVLERIKKLKPYQITTIYIVSALIPIILTYIIALNIGGNIIACILSFGISLGVYIVGLIHYNDAYYEMLSSSWITTAGLMNSLTILASFLLKKPVSVTSFVVVFGVSVCICAFASNQKGIDYMMERRGHSMDHLPPKIRYYNLALVSAVLIAAALFFIFKSDFAAFAYEMLEAIKYGFIWILKLLVSFFGFLKGDTGKPEKVETPENDDGAFIDESVAGNPLVSKILVILIIITILVLAIKPLGRLVKKLFVFVVKSFRSWLSKTKTSNFIRMEKTEYYTDHEESLDKSSKRKTVLGVKKEIRLWKSDLKKFTKMPETKEKMLFGYKLAVRGLVLNGYEIAPSDTQLDILKKAQKNLSGKAFEVATYCYNELVFGDFDASDLKLSEMDETLKAIKAFPVLK